MLVAAHASDLRGAQAVGLRSAFVPHPLEYGPLGPQEPSSGNVFDVVADDFVDLADRLAAPKA